MAQDLSSVHPFNFKLPLQSAPNLLASFVKSGVTGNPAVSLIDGNVHCETCHNPHVQSIDASNAFLVVDNSSSGLCLACHTLNPYYEHYMMQASKGVRLSTSTSRTGKPPAPKPLLMV